MTRMEGSELVYHHEDHLYAFKDQYPFCLSDRWFYYDRSAAVRIKLNADLRQWIHLKSDEVGTASRGVKGGFPEGGYLKKN